MIQKLRRRLILVSMLSLFAVLTLIFSISIGLSYVRIVREADETLAILADNGGVFPRQGPWAGRGDIREAAAQGPAEGAVTGRPTNMMPDASADAAEPSEGERPEDGAQGMPASRRQQAMPDDVDMGAEDAIPTDQASTIGTDAEEAVPGGPAPAGGTGPGSRNEEEIRRMADISPEMPYESRFFYADVTDDGSITGYNLESISAVDLTGAEHYVDSALSSGRMSGFLGIYRFLIYTGGTEKRVYFLDCSRALRTLRGIAMAAVGASLAGMLAVLLLISFFSGRIVRPIAESYAKQRRFITDAGHDIKTPLAIINANAEILEMDLGEDNEWLQEIINQTGRLAGLTDDLITLSRMEEAEANPVMTGLPFSEIVSDTVQPYRVMAENRGLTFVEEIADGIKIIGDEKLIVRLLNIILDNAVKYCSEGGTIRLVLRDQSRQAVLVLSNSTDNVSAEDLPHLFDRFYRIDESRNSASGGYGIGLSIASSIADAHKARISAALEDGMLCITLRLQEAQ